MGLSEAQALGSVRLTLGRGTGAEDVAIAGESLWRAFEAVKNRDQLR
jgi:cysteine sulfinate desulfinase/cysteine desulfurase-like protein